MSFKSTPNELLSVAYGGAAYKSGIRLISISYGASGISDTIEQNAISLAYLGGCVLVAAAGNGGQSAILSYPAADTGVLSVGATVGISATSDVRAAFSNNGNWVQIAAPGSNIDSTGLGQSVQSALVGTSFSAPFVTGTVALLPSIRLT
jgi:subtilisin family serine protease